MNKIEVLTEMSAATATLAIGLAAVLVSTLPADEVYKVEVLLEGHNDKLKHIISQVKKEKGE